MLRLRVETHTALGPRCWLGSGDRNVCESTTPTPTQDIMPNVACSYHSLCLELHELHIYYFWQTASLLQTQKKTEIAKDYYRAFTTYLFPAWLSHIKLFRKSFPKEGFLKGD